MDIKKKILKIYEDEIKELENKKKENIEEVEYLNKEIDGYNSEIAELKQKKSEVEKSGIDKLGEPSTIISKNTMGLSDDMVETANEWIIKHEMTKHSDYFYGLEKPLYKGAIGCADYEISWSMTSIGYLASIRCTKCDEDCYLGER